MNRKMRQILSVGLVFLFLVGCSAPGTIPTPTEALEGQLSAEPGGTTTSTESNDLITQVNFNRGGSIRYTQNGTLKLFASRGWAWGFFPEEIDIGRYSWLTMNLRTTDNCIVYFELKDRQGPAERALVGTVGNNNVWKMRLTIPNTDGVYQSITIDLTEHFRPEITPRLAKVIVFSDPKCDIEIRSIDFSEDEP